MSKYDKERQALGLKVTGASSVSQPTSKYASERKQILSGNVQQVKPIETKKETPKLTEEELYYKSHPLADKIVHNPISQFWDKKIVPFLDVAGTAMKGAITGDYASADKTETTGNNTADTVAKAAGTIGAFALPVGGAASVAQPIRTAAEGLTSKIIPNAQNLIAKAGKKALTGAIESVPYSAQQIATQKDIKTPQDAIKTIGLNAALGSGTELALAGLGKAAKAIKKSAPTVIEKVKKPINSILTDTVDNTRTTGKVSEQAKVMSNVARSASGTVNHIIDNGLVDMAGKPVQGKAVREIFNLPKSQHKAFDDYLFETHNIDRVKQGKELTGHTSEESRQIISNLERQYPHFKDKAKEVNTLLKNMLNEWGVKSGLVDDDVKNLVQDMYKNYVPGYREMPGVEAIATKSRGMGTAKIINKAIGGDDPLMSLQKSIPMLINKTVKAARKNEVYQEILKAVRNGDTQYAKILDTAGKIEGVAKQKFANAIRDSIEADGIEGIANLADKALSADPKMGYMLTVMENGNPVKLQVTKELFDSLQALNKVDDTALNKYLQGIKKFGTNPFKSLVTGYNPFFAIRNVARDIPTAYIQGTENNPFKFARNLGSAAKDMIKKSDGFQEYKALGGEGGNYFNVEKGLQPKGKLEKPLKVLSGINNFTETLPRYAEYKGTLRREGTDYATKMKALYNAQEVTTNFGRHGDVTKAIDAVVPYFNPAVQGIDKTVRTFTKPSSWAKALAVVTVPTAGIYAINQAVDKKGYDALDNRTKDTYFVFPQGDGKFIKIPKTREAGVMFGALFERIARQVEGQPQAFKGFGNTVGNNFLVQNPLTDNIASPLLQLKYNKDFANRDIVPQYMISDKRSPKLQYDEKTTELAKTIGNKFNLSPKQIDFIAKAYGGIVATIAQPINTKGGNVGNVIKRQFTADAAYNTETTNRFYDKAALLKQKATDRNILENIPSKQVTEEERMSNLYQGMTRYISDIRNGISNLGQTEDARQRQIKLLDILDKLDAANTFNEASALKNELVQMAKPYKKY